jgi:hypothetical protein
MHERKYAVSDTGFEVSLMFYMSTCAESPTWAPVVQCIIIIIIIMLPNQAIASTPVVQCRLVGAC